MKQRFNDFNVQITNFYDFFTIIFLKMANILEQLIDKLSTVPNDTNRHLRLIRQLDKRIQSVQASLVQQQKDFVEKIKASKQKKIEQNPQLMRQYAEIVKKQKIVLGFAKEKVLIANQLNQLIQEQTTLIKKELNLKSKDRAEEQRQLNLKKKKIKTDSKPAVQKEQFLYDLNQPKYCYCGKQSYGQMVMCENNFCEKEWFHVDCIEQKNLPQKWYCMQCRKLKQKLRHPISKSYL